MSENSIGRLASAAGVEPDQMAGKIAEVHSVFHEAASDHLAARGVFNLDAFGDFIEGNPQWMNRVREGARGVVMSGDTSHLDAAAVAFLEQAADYAPDEVTEALDTAGIGYERRPDGVLMLNIEGQMVSWNVAVRQQLIRLS